MPIQIVFMPASLSPVRVARLPNNCCPGTRPGTRPKPCPGIPQRRRGQRPAAADRQRGHGPGPLQAAAGGGGRGWGHGGVGLRGDQHPAFWLAAAAAGRCGWGAMSVTGGSCKRCGLGMRQYSGLNLSSNIFCKCCMCLRRRRSGLFRDLHAITTWHLIKVSYSLFRWPCLHPDQSHFLRSVCRCRAGEMMRALLQSSQTGYVTLTLASSNAQALTSQLTSSNLDLAKPLQVSIAELQRKEGGLGSCS